MTQSNADRQKGHRARVKAEREELRARKARWAEAKIVGTRIMEFFCMENGGVTLRVNNGAMFICDVTSDPETAEVAGEIHEFMDFVIAKSKALEDAMVAAADLVQARLDAEWERKERERFGKFSAAGLTAGVTPRALASDG